MARRECEMVDELEPLSSQPVPNDILCVLSAEFAKIFCLDDDPLASACFHLLRLEPATDNPVLDFLWTNMERHRQGVLGEAVLAHLDVCSEALKHMPDRALRAAQQSGDFVDWMQVKQFQQALLLRRGPRPMRSFALYAHASHESSASPSWIPRFRSEFRDQGAQFLSRSLHICAH